MKKIFVGAAIMLLVWGLAAGAVPNKINYEGRLTDSSGSALTGAYNMRFSITSDQAGNNVVWGPESQTNVAVTNGVFAVFLGIATPITTAELTSDTRYLKVEIANPPSSTTNYETLSPHSQIVSVAYAIKSEQADSVTGGYVSKLTAGPNITLSGDQGEVTISASGGSTYEVQYDDMTIGLNGSGSLEVKDAGITGSKLAGNINITTTGIVTATAFVGDGSGITGVSAGNATSLEGHPAAYFAPVSDLDAHATATTTHGVSSALVGINDSQTLTNKGISGSTNTLTNISGSSLASNININTTGIVTATAFSGDGSALGGVLTAATDYGRSGVSADLYESTTKLSDKYATNASLGTFETITHAAATFAAKTDLGTFETASHAAATYASKTDLGTFETAAHAASVYSTISDLSTHATATATHGATGAIVGTTNTQSLSNKTFTGTTTMAAVTVTSISGDGSGLNNLNAVRTFAKQGDSRLTGDVDLKAGTNITLTQTGNTIEVTASGGSGSVTLVGAGAGLAGGPITTTGTLEVKYDNSTVGLNGSGSLEVKNAGLTGAKFAPDINISTTGTITAAAFSGDGSALTGVLSESVLAAHATATATHGATGAIVGTTNAQTLSNKTFTGTTTIGAVVMDNTGVVTGVKSMSIAGGKLDTIPAADLGVKNRINVMNTIGGQDSTLFLADTINEYLQLTYNAGGNYGVISTSPTHNLYLMPGGKVGVNTTDATSMLTVTGTIETKTGGVKFPDGTTQLTASIGGSGTVTRVDSGAGLYGGPITTTGTLEVKYDNSTIGLNGSGSLEVKAGSIGTTQLSGTLNINTTGIITAAAFSGSFESTGVIQGPNCMFTPEGGYAVRLINATGGNSVKGTVVAVTTEASGTLYFTKAPANSDRPIGAVYDSGVANLGYCWVVVSGIAEVLLKDSTASTAGHWVGVSDTAGRAFTVAEPSAAQHPREIGHCLESVTSGTDKLMKVIMHFN